jgi:hypothetical protein
LESAILFREWKTGHSESRYENKDHDNQRVPWAFAGRVHLRFFGRTLNKGGEMTRHEKRLARFANQPQKLAQEKARIVRHYDRVLKKRKTMFTPIEGSLSWFDKVYALFFPARVEKRKQKWQLVWAEGLISFYERYFRDRYSVPDFIGFGFKPGQPIRCYYK